jgi:hypothetical protein
MFFRSPRSRSLSFLAALTVAIFVVGTTPQLAEAKTRKPSLAEIAAAKQVEEAKQAAAAIANTKLSSATKTLNQLSAISDSARAKYLQALTELARATSVANSAAAHAVITQAAVNVATRVIGKMATNAYIMGSGFTDLDSVLHANGPQDLIDRLSTLNSLGANNSIALQHYQTASVVAKAAKAQADAT